MKVILRDYEIELIPENEHERDALARLHEVNKVEIDYGKSEDRSWPPDPRKTNVVLKLPKDEK